MTPQALLTFIHARRFPLGNEKETQAAMAGELRREGIAFEREWRLSEQDIPDFFFRSTGLVVEVKIKKGARAIYSQIERYCEHDSVQGIVLVTNAAMGLPRLILGKPAFLVSLGRAWL